MAAAKEGRNRRRFPRVPVRGEMSGRIHTVASAPVLDLSEGGALLEVPCVLRPRSLYSFRLSLGEGKVLTLQSSVVRSYVHAVQAVAKGESRLQYRAAIQFINLSDGDRVILRERLYGSAEPVAEDGASPTPDIPELLLEDILASDADAEAAPSPLEGLTALLEEAREGGGGAAAAAPGAGTPLPALPDVESLPPLPDVEPWTPSPARGNEPKPEAAGSGFRFPASLAAPDATPPAPPDVPAARPQAEADKLPAAARADLDVRAKAKRETAPSAETAASPVAKPAPAEPVAATDAEAPQAEAPSTWQRLKGWISAKPDAERESGSMLGLGPEPPPVRREKPPVVEERRDFARVVVEGSVSGEMGLVMQSDVEAISIGGLRARLPFSPEEGARLQFSLEIDQRPITVPGLVRNVEQTRNDKGDVEYMVGLEFAELDESVRVAIREFVERRLEEEAAEFTPVD